MIIKMVTEYMAAITIPSMSLWTAGYLLGGILGLTLSPLNYLFATLALTVAFALLRLYSIRIHGAKVVIIMSEGLVKEIIKEN